MKIKVAKNPSELSLKAKTKFPCIKFHIDLVIPQVGQGVFEKIMLGHKGMSISLLENVK